LKPGLIFPVFIALLTASCALFQSEIDSVSDMLPRDSDLSGWARISPPAEYSGNRISRYKNDYLKTGIERISVCSYENIGQDKPSITVETIRFDTVLNSYGLFSQIAAGMEFTAETENEFYGLNKAAVLRGEYLVYVFTGSGDEDTNAILKSFIRASLKYIGSGYSREKLNERINILKYRDKYGIIYSIKPVEKPEGIDSIYYTPWHNDKKLINVYISERESFADSYRLYTGIVKKGYIIAESGTVYTAFNKDKDSTFSFISVSDKWIYGCWSSPDIETGKKITEVLRSRITDYNPR